MATQFMYQELDGVDTWIEVSDTAVPAHVAAGWRPCDPPEVVPVPLSVLEPGKPAPPLVVPLAPPGESDLAFAAEQAAAEASAPDPSADEPPGSRPSSDPSSAPKES